MAKAKPQHDPEREQRIPMEIVVDAYDAQERALGCSYYLQEQLRFPFTVTCIAKRAISALHVKDELALWGQEGLRVLTAVRA